MSMTPSQIEALKHYIDRRIAEMIAVAQSRATQSETVWRRQAERALDEALRSPK